MTNFLAHDQIYVRYGIIKYTKHDPAEIIRKCDDISVKHRLVEHKTFS